MKARVRPDTRWHSVTACAGVHFNKRHWTEIPVGLEEEALNHPYLEVELDEAERAAPVVEQAPTPPPTTPPAENDVIDASKAAIDLAANAGLDLAEVVGTGAGGKITINDVRNAIDEGAEL